MERFGSQLRHRIPGSLPCGRVLPRVGNHFGMYRADFGFPATRPLRPAIGTCGVRLQGLEPSTVYTVVLARMALQVNGELDQNQVLTGNPGGRNLTNCPSWPGRERGLFENVTCNFDIAAGITRNGQRRNQSGGARCTIRDRMPTVTRTVDCIMQSRSRRPLAGTERQGAEVTTAAEDFTAANTPFGSNEVGASVACRAVQLPAPLRGGAKRRRAFRTGAPTVRMQLGPDIDADGNVINNAMGPFPAGPCPQRAPNCPAA